MPPCPPPIALPCAVAVSVRLCYLVRASCIFIISLALEPIKSQRCWYKISRYNFSVYLCNTAITDLSEISMESSTVSLYVLGKCSNEMVALHLLKTYCLPTLMYGCEVRSLTNISLHKVNVAWNNCFRRIFSCCWRESTRPLQFFCNISLLPDSQYSSWWTSVTTTTINICEC